MADQWSKIRPILALGVICCLAELSYAVVNVLAIPAYVSKELHIGEYVGVIMGAFLLAEAVGRLWLGALSDIVGRKPLIIAGPLISGVASLLVIQTTHPLTMAVVRIVDGLGAAAFWPAVFAAVGDSTIRQDRSSAMGVLNVAYMVGLAFGPLAGGWVNHRFGVYHAAFYLSMVLFAFTALLALAFVPKKAYRGSSSAATGGEQFAGMAPLLHAAALVWRLLVVAFTTFFGIGLLIPVIELFALDKYGIGQETFGSLFLVPAIVIAMAAVPLGRMGDRWGRLTSIRVGMFLCSVALWAVPFVNSYYVLAAGAIIVGLGFLLAFPAWMALVSDVTDEKSRGSVLGAAGMAQGFGAILGAVIGGKLYHTTLLPSGLSPHDTPFYLAGGSLTLSFLLASTLLMRYGNKHQKPRSAA